MLPSRCAALDDPFKLFEQAAPLCDENNAGDGGHKHLRLDWNQIGSQHEYAARLQPLPGLRARLARAHQCFDCDLKILDVGRLTLVEDYQIDGELLHPPIFVRLKQLAGDIEILRIGDA